MKVEIKTEVRLTEEEAQAIEMARDILCNYESHSCGEQDEALADMFQDMMGYSNMDYSALPVTIDFLTLLLRESGWEKEED